MTVRFAVAVRDAAQDAALDRTDAGSGPGMMKIYTGAQPATADTAASGTLLGTFTLADPAWAASSAGVKALDADPDLSTTAEASGTVGWARVVDSAGAAVVDLSVGAAGSGADVTVNTTNVVEGGTVKILTGTITDPA